MSTHLSVNTTDICEDTTMVIFGSKPCPLVSQLDGSFLST